MSVKGKTTIYDPESLMREIHKLVVEHGCYTKAETIMDYFLPDSNKERKFSNYKFDIIAYPNFGSCEGIYIDVVAIGQMDKSDKEQTWNLGTYKTLNTDLESIQIMGELCGSIVYYASEFVNNHFESFDSN